MIEYFFFKHLYLSFKSISYFEEQEKSCEEYCSFQIVNYSVKYFVTRSNIKKKIIFLH